MLICLVVSPAQLQHRCWKRNNNIMGCRRRAAYWRQLALPILYPRYAGYNMEDGARKSSQVREFLVRLSIHRLYGGV